MNAIKERGVVLIEFSLHPVIEYGWWANYNLIEEEEECINILLNDSRVVQVLDSTPTSTSAATTSSSAATPAATIATTNGDLFSIGFAFFLLFLSSIFFHISTIGTCKNYHWHGWKDNKYAK
jgi:hypothetical protein